MEDLFFYNPWWKGEPIRGLKPYRREIFGNIEGYIKTVDRIIIIKGPRRVGKTTLIYQLISGLLDSGVDPKKILYVSFDDPKTRASIDKILDFYKTEIIKRPLEGGPIYVFLDEVQFLEDWQYELKKYYDRGFPIKFIVSGSSATLIKKGAESLMGRTIEEIMLPFSFREFFEYRTGKKAEDIDIENIGLLDVKKYEEKAKIVFSEYLEAGGFPSIFDADPPLRSKLIMEDIIEKALYRDAVSLYKIKNPEILEKLFIYLVTSTAQTGNINNISSTIGLSRLYTSKYITYLKNAYFILAFKKYSRSAGKTARSLEKFYCIDPAIIKTFLSADFAQEIGHTIESIIARHLLGKDVYYWKNYHEVDFIVKGEETVPVEVKYKSQYTEKDFSGLLEFCAKFKTEKGVLVTKDVFDKKVVDRKTFYIVPAWLYLLSIK